MQTCHVMVYMTDEHVDQCPRADSISAGGAAPKCGLVAHVVDRKDVCAAQVFEFLNQIL